ncbi:hypothetical protein DEA98_10450 [Brucella pseudogrignonensis]|uniref:Uncharacterized protein n=1 Tax=Brucella pseudogrignonensis TaxID=419475 RepID=A0A7Y3WX23_9HYPH|nr:hypothetical protein [Brucella pseudogrignonensis]MCM0751580.1 hypothetical protein [Brucella pseudogrignonensis]MCM0751613.1 hypothetical protein [Brucella pseudogrignonensis]NNV22030.1 hypothetical protein [Brucella pseudogrignonensis]
MKIIAQTGKAYLVEMTADEIAMAAGFSSTYNDEWAKKNGGRRDPVIGSELNVNAAYRFHSRISEAQEKCVQSAGFLRGLADMIERSLPDVITQPEVSNSEESAS